MSKENRNRELTLGSLFSGSGGFELAGQMAGIRPIWDSDIEPFPILVTTKRFPDVTQLGDVSRIYGAEIEPVDIITFGSPCTGMSIAGKREGLADPRSGLFHQAIRIIREMREATDGRYPEYAVWENVPGAFSSNKGEDFRAVLKALCEIKYDEILIPEPPGGKWTPAGEILGDGFSLAWRTIDAQYWGVPQRRKRIYLVTHFTGTGAGEILFESEGLSGYSAASFRAWQRAAAGVKEGTGTSGGGAACCREGGRESDGAEGGSGGCGRGALVLNDQGGAQIDVSEEVTATLRAQEHGHQPCVLDEPKAAGFCTEHSAKARSIGYEEGLSPTLRAGTVPAAIYENHSQATRYTGPLETAPTVSATYGTGGNNQPFVVEEDKPVTLKIRSGCEGGGKGALLQEDLSATLACNNDQTLFVPKCYGICSKQSHSMLSDNPHSGFYEAETTRCLDTRGGNPTCAQGGMAVVAFHVNQRNELIDLEDKSGALMATRSDQMQTFVIQGSMIGRDDKNGPQGDGVNEDVCFTLNTVDRHAVACERQVAYGIDRAAFNQGENAKYGFAIEEELQPTMVAKGPGAVAQPEGGVSEDGRVSAECGNSAEGKNPLDGSDPAYSLSKASYFTKADEEVTGALVATDYKDPPAVGHSEPEYTVRRLTPIECARLQGFPDWWCDGLEIEEPTDKELAFWTEIFESYRRGVTHAAKPKTEKQIRKWLSSPHNDGAAYKLWGNGVALPCVYFVMCGIAWYAEREAGGDIE